MSGSLEARHPDTLGAGQAVIPDGASAADMKVTPGAWLTLGLLFCFLILSIFDQRILVMMVDPIKADFGLTDVQMGFLLGPAFALAYCLFQIPMGWAADRFPRRLVIYFGVTGWSLATIACGFTNSFWMLLAARACVGAGEASLAPASYGLLVDKFPRKRLTLALSIYGFANKIGTVVALSLGGVLITLAALAPIHRLPWLAQLQPWQMVFCIVGGAGLILAPAALAFRELPRPRQVKRRDDPEIGRTFVAFLKQNIAMVATLGAGFGLINLTVGAMLSWVPTYMSRHYGFTPLQYGSILGLMSAISILIYLAKGWAVDWLFMRGRKDIYVRFYTWLIAGSLPLVPFAFLQQNPVVFLVCFGILQSVALGVPMFLAVTSQSITPADLRGRMSGLLLLISMLMSSLGPLLPAAIAEKIFHDSARIGSGMCIVATVALSAALLLLRISLRWVGPAVTRYAGRPAVL